MLKVDDCVANVETYNDVKGVVVPLMTPIDDNEQVDFEALGNVIDHIAQGGCDGILICGSSAEFHRFPEATRRDLVRFAIKYADGRLTPYVGISDGGTQNALRNLDWAQHCGAKYAVSTLPYYFTLPYEEEQVQYFSELAQHSDVPLLMYNIPQNVAATIQPSAVEALAKNPRIIGIKDSMGSADMMQTLLTIKPAKPFKVFVGKEELCLMGLEGGAVGIVPSTGNVLPKLFSQLYKACAAGDWAGARALQQIVIELNGLNKCAPSMIGHFIVRKTLMEYFGLCNGRITRPVARLSDEHRQAIIDLARKYQHLF